MTDLIRGSIRVSIDSSFHEFYKDLSEGNDPEKAPFRTMKDLFMLAVCLGYQQGNRKSITGTKRQIFHWAQFSDQVDIPILKAIAIATTKDIQILADPERVVQIAEEYANAGIAESMVNIRNNTDHALWSTIEMMRSIIKAT